MKNKIQLKAVKIPENKFTLMLKKQKIISNSLDKNTLNRLINPLKNINEKVIHNSVFCFEYFKDSLIIF